jgi:hypothetical protein
MTLDTDWMVGEVGWDWLTRKPCVTVIGVTFNNVGLARAKSPCFKYGWPSLGIVSWPCCVGILKEVRQRRLIKETQLRASVCSRRSSV